MLRTFFEAAGPVTAAALWQGAVVALGLEVCLRLSLKTSPADRFRAWAAGFAVVLVLPFLPLLTNHIAGGAGAPAKALIDLDPRWGWAIAGLWVAASAWRAGELAVHALKTRGLWRRAVVVERRSELGLEICTTRELDRPGVIGFWRPRILIPEWLMGRLSAGELEQVVLHEAEHLRRRDDWTNLAQKLALVVFPLNPALAWIDRRLNHERELACDDGVVRATGKPRAYAACLANLAERGLQYKREALSLGAWRKRSELAGRVHRLLKSNSSLNPVAARVLLGTVGCGLIFGAVELARAPQLVAFVARPVVAQAGAPDLVNLEGRGVPGYRAESVVARVKAGPRAIPTRKIAQDASRTAGETDALVNVGGTGLNESQNVAQRLVALTVSEHMLAAIRNGQVISDYELEQPDAQLPEQMPLRPLILRIRIVGTPGSTVIADFEIPEIYLQPPPPPSPANGDLLVFEL